MDLYLNMSEHVKMNVAYTETKRNRLYYMFTNTNIEYVCR
jgi:hypothetical protein